jgi:formate C-acetyltransferase
MNERLRRLREQSIDAPERVCGERARLMTEFTRENLGRYSAPVLRARAFAYLCDRKTIVIGRDDLIVGERGTGPKATPTYPEITCHSIEDLKILDSRPKTFYRVGADVLDLYDKEVIPFWRGRCLRDRMFERLPDEWKRAYEAGIFTEFMEQRAPGHTVADGKIYHKGMLDFRKDIAEALSRLDSLGDPEASRKTENLKAFDIAAVGLIRFAERHAGAAERLAESEPDGNRRADLRRIAEVCRRVPARPPRDFHEALQMYWFCHLGVITEMNGWDSFNPGHLDQHLLPFYQEGLADCTLTRESAKEILGSMWIKFNNQPAPPKVGVTAAESGTYTDFANINIGGLTRDGRDAVNEVSTLLLETIDDLHTLQPSTNIQLSRKNSDEFLQAALCVVRKGYGFPSLFNADAVVQELVRQGKSLEDAREGGTSGCVEAGAFGKEAYILTGYFNLVKVLEITLHDGFDPRTKRLLGPQTGDPKGFRTYDDLFLAWARQVRHFADIKVAGNHVIERMYAETAPVPFLSILIDDCIARGLDYNEGGARYNTSYIQGVGIGTLADAFAAIKHQVFEAKALPMEELLGALDADFAGKEPLRQRLLHKSPKYGNDDDRADDLMRSAFDAYRQAVEGRSNARGGRYYVNMLPTTCHIYFGQVTGATPDGRRAGRPLSEGISPVQGADRLGPTAVFKSAAKMPHYLTGGTLLNQKFSRPIFEGEENLRKLGMMVRAYFRMGGHHVQFNVVDSGTLRAAQEDPEKHRGLIVRVAGYSDYFTDLSRELQDEILSRTEHPAD